MHRKHYLGINAAVEYSFKKKGQLLTLDTQSSVKINGEIVQDDPMLLFQRLAITNAATNGMILSRNAIQPLVRRRQVDALILFHNGDAPPIQ